MKRVRVRLRIPLLSAAGLLALLVMAMPPPARADSDRPEYERTFQKTIAVKGGQRLEIEHSQGAVRVSGQNVSELKIAAKIRVSASDEAEGRKFGERTLKVGLCFVEFALGLQNTPLYAVSDGGELRVVAVQGKSHGLVEIELRFL